MADEHAFFHRLDVHVARAAGDRAVDHEIDQVDDRRRIRALARRAGRRRRRLEDVDVAAGHERRTGGRHDGPAGGPWRGHGDHQAGRPPGVLRQRLVGIAILDRVQDVGARGHDLLDAVAGLELEILDQAEKERIRHGDCQQVLLELDGDTDALEGDVLGDEHDGRGIGRLVAQADVRKAELVGEGLGDLLFGSEVEAYEDGTDAFAGLLMLREGGLEIVLRDQAGLDETLPDFLAHSFLYLRGSQRS